MTKTCEWNGKRYKSIQEAATALGLTHRAMSQRYCRGQRGDADMVKRPICWEGVTYPSMRGASRLTGIPMTTLRTRVRKGYTSVKDMKNKRRNRI